MDEVGRRCPRCWSILPSHGLVHIRHGNGGGHNEPCPAAGVRIPPIPPTTPPPPRTPGYERARAARQLRAAKAERRAS